MDVSNSQVNDSHVTSDTYDEVAGVLIPKHIQCEKVEKNDNKEGDVGDNKVVVEGASEGPISDEAHSTCPDSNNQNATSALEDDGPFCESVQEALAELEQEDRLPTLTNQSNSNTSTSQDLDQNTNESNNTNASACETPSSSADPATGEQDVLDDKQKDSAAPKRKRRSRSRQRSASRRQKNSSSSARRRKRSKSQRKSNSSSRKSRINSSNSNKRRRRTD